jgi:hypothetical protein
VTAKLIEAGLLRVEDADDRAAALERQIALLMKFPS